MNMCISEDTIQIDLVTRRLYGIYYEGSYSRISSTKFQHTKREYTLCKIGRHWAICDSHSGITEPIDWSEIEIANIVQGGVVNPPQIWNGQYTKWVMGKIWNDTKTDLIIRLRDGTEIGVHRNVIVSTCPAWKALLGSGCKEAREGVIIINDINPESVRAFVKALYSGCVENSEKLLAVLQLADRYRAEELMKKLAEKIKHSLINEQPGFCFEVIKVLRDLPESEIKLEISISLVRRLRNDKNMKKILEMIGI